MLGAEGVLVAGQCLSCQFESFAGPPAGDQRESQLTTLAIRLRVAVAKAAPRALQQILTGQNRLCIVIL
ncbi:MAG: hypothetical protein WAV02_23080, partial [Stellaceae bacterium]